MKLEKTKIPLFLLGLLLVSCNAVKRVNKGEYLLTKNYLYVDSTRASEHKVLDQIRQKPNSRLPLINIPLRLYFYNAARPNPDSLFYDWLYRKPKRAQHYLHFLSKKQLEKLGQNYVNWQKFKKSIGEKPVILDKEKIHKSTERLSAWYWNLGWFDTETTYKVDTLPDKRAKVSYYVTRHCPYTIDSLSTHIESPVVDSLYKVYRPSSLLKKEAQFNSREFGRERDRLTQLFRNNGLYYFDQSKISFSIDTINTNHQAHVQTVITNRQIDLADTTLTVPFKVRHISGVNIFTDYAKDNQPLTLTDSVHYQHYHIYSPGKLKYTPKSLADAIFIRKGDVYRDKTFALTNNRMTDIGVFQYPDIRYMEDPRDSTHTNLLANIFLKPRKKFGVTYDLDVSRSNIQDFGIRLGTSLLTRNIFGGMENLEVGVRASIGSSTDASVTTRNRFFNISEIGGDVKLTFPKIIFPFSAEGIIPKTMSPFTTLSTGISLQHNIGLDKQNLTGKFSYRWKPDAEHSLSFNLVDLQYVHNLNTNNYFNIYRNSFDRLNQIARNHVDHINPDYFEEINPILSPNPTLVNPDGANAFLQDFSHGVDFGLDEDEAQETRTLAERKDRLTENNLIFGSSFNYTKNTRTSIYDENFYQFRFNIEAMGNSLSLISHLFNHEKDEAGLYRVAGVRFSQYLKGEMDFIKHWDFGNKNVLAMKIMAGAAIPYGNSKNIPFVRSFFAGGSNDNRGWRPYDLGPGSSGGPNEFNEANMKLSFDVEYRFNLFGRLNSAVFIDAGNIWNLLDDVSDERARFSGFSDLKEIAVGSGFGLRYDFTYFVIRLDLGFKTYDPAYNKRRWFQDYNFAHSVLNVGINYPF